MDKNETSQPALLPLEEADDVSGEGSRKMYSPGSLLGDLSILRQKRLKPSTVLALENGIVLIFSVSQINKNIKVLLYSNSVTQWSYYKKCNN